MFNEVIFDLETQKFFDEIDEHDPSQLGVSIVSAYTRQLNHSLKEQNGQMHSFWEHELNQLWPLFQSADRIIGYNSVRFDVPVLAPYAHFPLKPLPHFDILEKIKQNFGRRVRLDVVAQHTLGTSKIDSGANAVRYWQAGDSQSLAKLKKYCEADTLLTRDLYDHALKHHKLKFTDHWNTPREIEVDFSYPPPEKTPTQQIGLF